MLELLEYLEKRHRAPYEPDIDDGPRNDKLSIHLHIAAARAFRLKQSDGLSEEVVGCLNEVERTMKRLLGVRKRLDSFDGPAFDTSLIAVSALAFVELGRASRNSGDYTRALHYLAEAAIYYDSAVAYNEIPMEQRYDAEDLEGVGAVESQLRSILEGHLTGLQISLKEAKSTFELVKAKKASFEDWAQVAADCKTLAYAWNVSGVEDETTDEQSGPLTWSEYWHGAHAWASAQLSPRELQAFLDLSQRTAAEDRLKNYFFRNDWLALPPRAQEALTSADQTWNSSGRVRRESILNELLRATEEMCYEFIWQPLEESKEAYPEIQSYVDKVAKHPIRSSPNVWEFINICERPFFRDFSTSRRLKQSEEAFMVKTLPCAMKELNAQRGPADHESGSEFPFATVEDCYRRFLGIGQSGVLPELARIGRKLRGMRYRGR